MRALLDNPPPRGAVVVVVVGLIATVAAALLTNENLAGNAAHLEYVKVKPLPDSAPAAVPGGGRMQLTDASLRATGVNVSGYSLFTSAAVLRFDAGSRIGSARVQCTQRAPRTGTEVGQTPGLRASYPRSSEENLADQPVPESGVQVEFSSHGTGLAEVQLEGLPGQFANEPGIKLEWPTYRPGAEHWRWFLPPGSPEKDLVLPFVSVWRTTKPAAVEIGCTVTTSAGEASVNLRGELARVTEPIAE